MKLYLFSSDCSHIFIVAALFYSNFSEIISVQDITCSSLKFMLACTGLSPNVAFTSTMG
jgi:hypothetical protein